MFDGRRVALLIPILDEEQTIGAVVAAVDRAIVDEIVVIDNGSRDLGPQRAAEAGARVVREDRRGYGSACLTGLATVTDAEILLFMDGDGSDDPSEIARVLAPLAGGEVDLVIGSRVLGDAEPGALTPLQSFGNSLTCNLVRWLWGVRYSDLGPFRAIAAEALERLRMADPDFGWTIEMQVKAAQQKMRITEVPVTYRVRRGGHSKVSGTVMGSYRAGRRILAYVFQAKFQELGKGG